MDNLKFNFDLLTIIINSTLRIITATIFLAFIIPLQIKEVKVKNGLRKLRVELLTSGIFLFLVNTIGLLIIIFKYLYNDDFVQVMTVFVTYFNTAGFLFVAIILYNIYHYNYSEESKKLHEKLEVWEKKKHV